MPWVDFAQVKNTVSLGRVLQDYGIWEKLRGSGRDHYRGRCPIHGGEGQDAFHGDLRKNLFHCFSCGAGGNVRDLVARLEQCSVREAALALQRRYLATACAAPQRPVWPRRDQLVTEKREGNPALRFGLSVLDATHPYVAARGLSQATAAVFGIGFYRGPGIMRGRLAIPIHNEHGGLVAYCGRSVAGEEPRYRFPSGFRKSAVLFNYHRAAASAGDAVLVVEGFFDSMKVHQAGFRSVVALMGAALSRDQEDLLIERFRLVRLMLDGDRAGRTASRAATQRLATRCSVHQILIGPGRQPDQMSQDEIRQILGSE